MRVFETLLLLSLRLVVEIMSHEGPALLDLRVRFQIIRNARIENVCKYQSCMVSKLRIIWKHIVGLVLHEGSHGIMRAASRRRGLDHVG